MFSKKLVSVLCYLVGILLTLRVVLFLVIFVWGYFAAPPLQLFDPRFSDTVKYLTLLQEIGITLFFFLLVASVQHMVVGVKSSSRKKA